MEKIAIINNNNIIIIIIIIIISFASYHKPFKP